MAHLNGIGIKNFRIFDELTWFDLKSINILTGPNSSGKSSLNKALLLLHENFNKSRFFGTLDFTSEIHHLGKFEHVLSNRNDESIVFRTSFKWNEVFNHENENWFLELTFKSSKSYKDSGKIHQIRIFEETMQNDLINLTFPKEKILDYHGTTDEFSVADIMIPQINLSLFFNKAADKKRLKDDPTDETSNESQLKRSSSDEFRRHISSLVDEGGIFLGKSVSELSKELSKRNIIPRDKGNLKIYKDIPYYDRDKTLFDYFWVDSCPDELAEEMARKVESLSIKAISSGICSFSNDIEFLEKLSLKWDHLLRFSGNNCVYNPETHQYEFKNIISYNYNSVRIDNLSNLSNYINLYEPLLYEVLYHIVNEGFSDLIFIDFSKLKPDEFGTLKDRNYYVPKDFQSIEKFVGEFIELVMQYFSGCFYKERFNYLPSLRSSVSRIYSNQSSFQLFEEILKEYYSLETDFNEAERSFIQYWLQHFKLGDKIIIERPEGVVSTIFMLRGKRKINLADLGFGTTQLVPILMQIIINARKNASGPHPGQVQYRKSIFVLEEPESNLHPNFQSNIADMLVDAADRFNIQFIIETHSEYLIRKLQYLTAKEIIQPEDTVIYYFNGENVKGKEKVKKIEIQKDGRLSSEFGPGFYDESTRLMMSLFTDENMN